MPSHVNPLYSSLLFLAGIISLSVFLFALKRRKETACSIPLASYALANLVWSFTYAIHWTNLPRPSEFFWIDMSYFGVVFTAPAFLYFTLCYAREKHVFLKSRKGLLFMSIIPALILILLWTDPWFGFFFDGKRESGVYFIYDGGLGFWLTMAWIYIIDILSLFFIFRAIVRYPNQYKRQIGLVVLGAFFPVAGSFLGISGNFPLKNIDISPISLSLTGAVVALAVFRYNFLDLMPISRDVIFETHRDAILVLDNRHRVVDANQYAQSIFQRDSLMGVSISELQARLPSLPLIKFSATEERFEFICSGDHEIIFEVLISPLGKEERKETAGYILSLHDITRRKEAERALKARLEKIEALRDQLREESIRDPLTNLYNRRYLHEILSHALPRAERDNTTLAFSLFDIDHFKNFNDQYGHDIGDEVLRVFSKTITDNARQGDIAFRFGGEEFLLLISGAKRGDVKRRINEIRKIVEKSTFIPADESVRVTFSAGIATFPEDGRDMDTLFKVADRRLYLAKEAGRNRVYDWRNEI